MDATEAIALLYAAQDGRCFYCRRPIQQRSHRRGDDAWVLGPGYVIDHFVPRSKGGDDSMANAVLTCEPCNTAKGDREPDAGEIARLNAMQARLT